jgi:hypothetical protein
MPTVLLEAADGKDRHVSSAAASSWKVAVEMNTPSILCDRSQCLGQLRHARHALERLQLLRSQSQHVNHTSRRRNLDTLHSLLRGDTGLLDLPKLAPGDSQPGQTQRLVTHQFRWPVLQRSGTRRGDRTRVTQDKQTQRCLHLDVRRGAVGRGIGAVSNRRLGQAKCSLESFFGFPLITQVGLCERVLTQTHREQIRCVALGEHNGLLSN